MRTPSGSAAGRTERCHEKRSIPSFPLTIRHMHSPLASCHATSGQDTRMLTGAGTRRQVRLFPAIGRDSRTYELRNTLTYSPLDPRRSSPRVDASMAWPWRWRSEASVQSPPSSCRVKRSFSWADAAASAALPSRGEERRAYNGHPARSQRNTGVSHPLGRPSAMPSHRAHAQRRRIPHWARGVPRRGSCSGTLRRLPMPAHRLQRGLYIIGAWFVRSRSSSRPSPRRLRMTRTKFDGRFRPRAASFACSTFTTA